mmetsp:Transcript_63488/g.128851  ORF Transcript_63488/g.128851 Transcript_63488/m.128851 type:complete len:275 (+) Transcript_63488:241-1065(+)
MAGCCRSKSTCIMYTVNIVLLALGIALTALAGIVKTHRSELIEKTNISASDIDAVMPADDVNMAIAGGCLLMVVALVGVCGARMYEGACGKTLLCIYALFMLVVIVLEIAAFAMVIVLTGHLDDFNSDVTSNKQVKQADKAILNFVNDTRCFCCPKSYTVTASEVTCNPSTAGQDADTSACGLLKDIVTEANCANNKAFTKPVVNWINARLRVVGIFSIVVALIQLCTLCASCCLLCRGKQKKQDAFQPAGPGYQNPQPVGSGAAQSGKPVMYA